MRDGLQGSSEGNREGRRTGASKFRGTCAWCGHTHKPRACRAYGKTCSACGAWNHYAAVCRRGIVSALDQEGGGYGETGQHNQEADAFIGHIQIDNVGMGRRAMSNERGPRRYKWRDTESSLN